MDDVTSPIPAHAPRQSRVGIGRIGIGLAAVAVGAAAMGVTSIASAATGAATATPKATAAPAPPAPVGPGEGGGFGHGGMRHGGMGPGGMGPGGMGPGGRGLGGEALHGEFVVQKQDGTYQTVDAQAGVVTAVSATSISVKSVDGFAKTYVVLPATNVNAARDGIGSVKVGDSVHVEATVAAGTATAVGVMDVTTLKAGGMGWHDEDKAPTSTSSSPASTSTS